MNPTRPSRYLVPIVLTAIAGCRGTALSGKEFEEYLTDRSAPRLMVQVCLPDKQAFFDALNVDVTDMPVDEQEVRKIFLAGRANGAYTAPQKSTHLPREYEAIRQWRAQAGGIAKPWIPFGVVDNVKGVASAGSSHIYLAGSTEGNQAVFAGFTHQRPGDVIAVSVSLAALRGGKTQWRTFWFKPPKNLPAAEYSSWVLPAAEEGPAEKSAGPRTWWLWVHGEEVPAQPVGADAPRARYRLLSKEAYWQLDKAGRRAMATVKLQRLVDRVPDEEDRFWLVPVKGAVIPSC